MSSQSDDLWSSLAARVRASFVESSSTENLHPSDSKWRTVAIHVSEKGWSRPFLALKTFTPKERNLIRETLNFEWAGETSSCVDPSKRADLESWELIDCNVRGIAARLHSISEQLNPTTYITWRRALIRVLDLMDKDYPATADEVYLERMVLEGLGGSHKRKRRPQTGLPVKSLSRIPKHGGTASVVLSEIAECWDAVLGSEDKPAIAAIYSICAKLT
ncbi:MAG: hypothetical protein C4K60_13360 [Ideonella sp. MAG2]|nr:MAG: hypothetical protein C4K60_13360 [Ideonella sp. MAG2]